MTVCDCICCVQSEENISCKLIDWLFLTFKNHEHFDLLQHITYETINIVRTKNLYMQHTLYAYAVQIYCSANRLTHKRIANAL